MRGGGARRAAEGGAVGGCGVPGRIRVLKKKEGNIEYKNRDATYRNEES